ncbi:MAG: hypothetical protein GKS00_16545 [Alphaproteobacteria bacterium]|nr:hypothetical protein [Alphaproteobacteria bacterium]
MNEQNNAYGDWSISIKQIGIIILAFIFGLTTALLFENTKTDVQTNFTTTELIGFVLSVIVSGASIVLAISAISLGRSSEQSVIKRSDESIRLQNEVFTKTTEALQRIEASTGVTEKRIEDIISGRVGDISHSIAELASGKRKGAILDPKELEKEISQSIMRGVRENIDPSEKERRIQKRKEDESRYEDFHQAVLLGFSNREGVKAQKMDHGHSLGSGDDLFDGIFTLNEKKVGISAFEKGASKNAGRITGYVHRVAKYVLEKAIQHCILVFDAPPQEGKEIIEVISKELNLYKDNQLNHISIIA